ncbi:hypothetical protein [Methanolapillus ohkumae]|uniref:Uncharacterized protein n=1 Tax=Methanolapillus ohkumae TaxID=3028298 RepID=A0AA96ZWD7_9EURY|nr:hypothetical protein MsAm2_14370 [Methanosarcinaceae archaeon Am2]
MNQKMFANLFYLVFTFISLAYLVCLDLYTDYISFPSYSIFYALWPAFIRESILSKNSMSDSWKMFIFSVGAYAFCVLLLDPFLPDFLHYPLLGIYLAGAAGCIIFGFKSGSFY